MIAGENLLRKSTINVAVFPLAHLGRFTLLPLEQLALLFERRNSGRSSVTADCRRPTPTLSMPMRSLPARP
jgi:hypothetical protein